MTLVKPARRFLIFCLLTVLTQVGGFIYVISLATRKWSDKWTNSNRLKMVYRLASFFTRYCVATFVLVPIIARPFGRVPLPLIVTNHLQPLNVFTSFLNRHYVRPELKQIAYEVAEEMNKKFPGTKTNYLDANFPFIRGFPLIPHLSHNDGKKLDLSFCYRDIKTGKSTNDCPSFIGYGICEEPQPHENNTADFCSANGYWQYGFLKKMVPQNKKKEFMFDSDKTKKLINLFATQPLVGKIFIEPHLKLRLNLSSDKIRFHGCQAVRHDDHIHVQLK